MFKFEKLDMDKVPLEINVPGKLAFNAEKTKVIAARVAGRIEKVFTFDGAIVKAGQPVAEYYSPDFISAQQEFLLSNQTLKLFNSGAYKDLIEDAKNTVDASANRLRVLGAANEEIEQLRRGIAPRSTMMIRAPIAGVVIKRNQDPGAYMNVGDILATIADPSALWFLGNIFEQDIPKISKGQVLKLRTESYPDKEFEAVANYVSPAIDPVTHALVIRCDVNNSDGLLRPEMFVNAKLQTSKVDAIVVPESAIIKIRNTKYVILRGDKDIYRRVPVTGFDMADKKFAITDGISSGAEVLVVGASLMNERFTNQEE
jgi:Cu(I)/Ag(I) efflux system membrane fusion protein